MNKPVVIGVIALAATGAALVGYSYYKHTVCVGLEADFLSAINGMKRAALTQPFAQSMGSDGKAHELAFKANARLMEYSLTRIGEECGDGARAAASDKGRDLLSD